MNNILMTFFYYYFDDVLDAEKDLQLQYESPYNCFALQNDYKP